MKRTQYRNFGDGRNKPQPDQATSFLQKLIEEDFFCDSLEYAEKITLKEFYAKILRAIEVFILNEDMANEWDLFKKDLSINVDPTQRQEYLLSELHILNLFLNEKIGGLSSSKEVYENLRRSKICSSIVSNKLKFLKHSFYMLHMLIYYFLKGTFHPEFFNDDNGDFFFLFESPQLRDLLEKPQYYEKMVEGWLNDFISARPTFKYYCLGDSFPERKFRIKKEEFPFCQIIEIVLHEILDICIKSFSPYDRNYLSLGQLYIGFCFNCGKLMNKAYFTKKHHSTYCKNRLYYQRTKKERE